MAASVAVKRHCVRMSVRLSVTLSMSLLCDKTEDKRLYSPGLSQHGTQTCYIILNFIFMHIFLIYNTVGKECQSTTVGQGTQSLGEKPTQPQQQ